MKMVNSKEHAEHHGLRNTLRSFLSRRTSFEEPSAPALHNEEALRRMIFLFLKAVEDSAIPGDKIDFEQFRTDIRSMSEKLVHDPGADDILILAGQFSATFKDYCERTSRFLSIRSAEYQKMVSMFTETVSSLTASGERSVVNLKSIEQQIERATIIEDIRTLRLRLGQCLGTIREEIRHQESLSAELLDRVARSTENNRTASECGADLSSEPKYDPVTGFPMQKEAEAALLKALQSDHASFAIPIVAKGADKIYAHLGNDVGDDFLHKFSERLRFLSNKGDRIFRWHGPSFVALVKRSTTVTEVKRELGHLSMVRFDDPIEVGERITWLPVSASWSVIAVIPPASSLFSRINEFTTLEASR
jgi:GGDEF domain-containing protein